MKQFDYIIAGGGAAGLTMAFLLLGHENSKKNILILDKETKSLNDRTWCFWEKEENLLECIVHKTWQQAIFRSPDLDQTFNIAPYHYKMIRGLDFYEFMKSNLSAYPNLTWQQAEINSINSEGLVKTSKGQYRAEWVFNSILRPSDFDIPRKYTQLLQHFKGYVIETPHDHFNPDQFTYMDFRVPQHNDCRFGYVLPLTPKTALVEYTLFSKQLLSQADYDKGLKQYINEFLNIGKFDVLEEEFGVIPMTDFPFPKQNGRVINIGISGGYAKPSTGYTFLRTQKILKQLSQNLLANKPPLYKLPHQKKRFLAYDATLLNVLGNSDYPAHKVFSGLFSKNGAQAVFKFLDEETNLKEELKIMSTTPIRTFGNSFLKQLIR